MFTKHNIKAILCAILAIFTVIILFFFINPIVPENNYYEKQYVHENINEHISVQPAKNKKMNHETILIDETIKNVIEELRKVMMLPEIFVSFILTGFIFSIIGTLILIIRKDPLSTEYFLCILKEVYTAFDSIFLLSTSFSLALLMLVIFRGDFNLSVIAVLAVIEFGMMFSITRVNLCRFEKQVSEYKKVLQLEESMLKYYWDKQLKCLEKWLFELIITASALIITLFSYWFWYFQFKNVIFIIASVLLIISIYMWVIKRRAGKVAGSGFQVDK